MPQKGLAARCALENSPAALAAHHLETVGFLDFEQMADGVRDDHVIAFVVAFFFFEFAEGLGEIAGHAGFFRDDEGF